MNSTASNERRDPNNRAAEQFAGEILAAAAVVDERAYEALMLAFAAVPRQEFFDSVYHYRIFQDAALPEGYSRAGVKPSTMARVLGLIGISKGVRVLELLPGAGYGSAVMSAAGASVFAVETVAPLAQSARKTLDRTGYQNVLVRTGDPLRGWAEHSPYDSIVCWVPLREPPKFALAQLVAEGGRAVVPILLASEPHIMLFEQSRGRLVEYDLGVWR